MGITYSTYEAKARFAEVMRQVREGKTVTVSYRGEPVAEIRPLQPEPATIEERLEDLERRGVLVRSSLARRPLQVVARRDGAVERFLTERNE
ncbi:MAG: type II toxin-antitoxin system prevent-host-death family antitoxin [Chloroflexi bacterium]|nr:type II toxin-antitoxin system prevent-host-death family antitoxin [Chloroflexota bacterium]